MVPAVRPIEQGDVLFQLLRVEVSASPLQHVGQFKLQLRPFKVQQLLFQLFRVDAGFAAFVLADNTLLAGFLVLGRKRFRA
ncbi:hypothetical protein D3C80_953580 [compost metagenome]